MIHFTENAVGYIRQTLDLDNKPSACFRIDVGPLGLEGFQYRFSVDDERYTMDTEVILEGKEFQTVLTPESANKLKGATIDWQVEGDEGEFVVTNPNEPKLNRDSQVVQDLLQTIQKQIQPVLENHHGEIELLKFDGKKAYVRFRGGCQGCSEAGDTLQEFVAKTLCESVDRVEEVVDLTNHEDGDQPYFIGIS